jgi:hypothetical protein
LIDRFSKLPFELANFILLVACANAMLTENFLNLFSTMRVDFIPTMDLSGKDLSAARLRLIGCKKIFLLYFVTLFSILIISII